MSESIEKSELVTENPAEEVNLSSPIAEKLEADETLQALEAIPDLLVQVKKKKKRATLFVWC